MLDSAYLNVFMYEGLNLCYIILSPAPVFWGSSHSYAKNKKKKEVRMETHLGKSSLVVLSTGMFLSVAALGLLNLMKGREGEHFLELSTHDWRKTASTIDELGKWPLFWKRCVKARGQVWRGGQPLHRNPHLDGAPSH